MNVIVSARRAFESVTKYRTTIGTTSKNVAIAMLRLVTTHDRRRSLKCLNLSHSCGDKRYDEFISKGHNFDRNQYVQTSEGNGQWLRSSLDNGSVSDGGLSATRSDPTLNTSLSRPSSFDALFDAREGPCNHSRSAARTLNTSPASAGSGPAALSQSAGAQHQVQPTNGSSSMGRFSTRRFRRKARDKPAVAVAGRT
jgi:hypothetical protein